MGRFLNAIYYWTAQRVKDPDELASILNGGQVEPAEVTQDDVKGELDAFASFMAATNS